MTTTYLIYWTGAFHDMKVLAFADREFAQKALDKTANDVCGEIATVPGDLAKATTSALIAIHNALAETPVKRFADRNAAHRRVFDLLKAKAPNLEVVVTERPKGAKVPAKKMVEPKPVKVKAPKAPAAEKAPRAFVYTWPDRRTGKTPRDGTKYAQLLGMVAKGTTQAKIAETFDWNRQAVYDGLWYLGKLCGFGIVTDADGTIHLETNLKDEEAA